MKKEKVSKQRMIEMGMDALDIIRPIINSIPLRPRDNHTAKLILDKSMSTQELYHTIMEIKKVINVIDRYEIEEENNDTD